MSVTPPKKQTDDHYYNIPDGASERYKKKVKRVVDGGRNTINTNPCFHEGEKSLKCRVEQKEDCTQFYDNYRMCKQFWTKVMKDRRKKGIEPRLPAPEDRAAVREDYKHFLPGKK